MLEDKLYSISDIAKITKLTDRTIRNYLANKTLKGVKIGGQWRFTREDIWDLFSNNEFEDDMKNKTKKKIVDFFDNNNDDHTACVVVNFTILDHKERKKVFEKINSVAKNSISKDQISFVDDNGQTKMVIFANVEYIYEILKILKGGE